MITSNIHQLYTGHINYHVDLFGSLNYKYLIKAKCPGNWLFCDLKHVGDKLKDAVVWTQYESKAFVFLSEQLVEEFKATYISPRPAEIIRMNNV